MWEVKEPPCLYFATSSWFSLQFMALWQQGASDPLLLLIMSQTRATPRTPYNYKYQRSPSPLNTHTHSRSPGLPVSAQATQKKLHRPEATHDTTSLYRMLEERGRIIVALEGKLEEQVQREIATLEQIGQEKRRFMGEAERRVRETQLERNAALSQLEQVERERECLAEEIMAMRGEWQGQRLGACREALVDREAWEQERVELAAEGEKLKGELVRLGGEIQHLRHLKKMELSEERVHWQGVAENLRCEMSRQRQTMVAEQQIHTTQLQHKIAALQEANQALQHARGMAQAEQLEREQELLRLNSKNCTALQAEQEAQRQKHHLETMRLSELNRQEVRAIEEGTLAAVDALRAEEQQLTALVGEKSAEIGRLLAELDRVREQHSEEKSNWEKMLSELNTDREEGTRREKEEGERLKVKYAQLREADLRSVKDYYQNEIELLVRQLGDKTTESQENRRLLEREVQEKQEMRKRHELEVLKLEQGRGELLLRLQEVAAAREEDGHNIKGQMTLTAALLQRDNQEKGSAQAQHQAETQQLQALITGKDQEIKQLNEKNALLRENSAREARQKKEEIDLLRQHQAQLELELKKEKIFYESEYSKKDGKAKTMQSLHEEEVSQLKQRHRDEYEKTVRAMEGEKGELREKLNRANATVQQLRKEIEVLRGQQSEDNRNMSEEMRGEKQRLECVIADTQKSLEEHHRREKGALQADIDDLKQQLSLKSDDLGRARQQCHQLEQKLAVMTEAEERALRSEQQVFQLGADQNLLKNMAELVRPRRQA